VSGSSFVATVVIARFGGPEELAAYSIGSSVLLFLIGAQINLFLLPYVVHRRQQAQGAEEHAETVFLLNVAFACASALALGVAALASWLLGIYANASALLWALAITAPCIIVREFVRRYSFAQLNVAQSLLTDALVCTAQIGALALLAVTGHMSAESATIALALACCVSLVIWKRPHRSSVRREAFLATARQSWATGRWLFASQIIAHTQGYIAYWLAAVFLGAAQTGVFVAAVSIIAFANPLIFGIDNLLVPRLAKALHNGGGSSLLREAWRSALLLAVIMFAFVVFIVALGNGVLAMLYPAPEFAAQHDVLIILSIAAAALAVTLPASSGLAVLKQPRVIVTTGAMSLVITVISILTLLQGHGLVGIACGMAIGNMTCALGRWIAFLTRVLRPTQEGTELTPPPQPVVGFVGVGGKQPS
jgi:O-antigen/teichoic acid export membrane protein